MREMSPSELHDYLECANPRPLLLDVREPWEYRHCHIEGSRLLPMGDIPSAAQELSPDQEIVVICHHGIRSRQVAWFLERSGFKRVINLSGGLDAWARAVDREMPTY